MTATAPIVSVAVSAPLRQAFDYRLAPGQAAPARGARVWVPFGRSERLGVVVAMRHGDDDERDALKPLVEIIDAPPLLPEDVLALAEWAAGYYHHAIGEVLATTLPTALRRRRQPPETGRTCWAITAAGQAALVANEVSGARQQALLRHLLPNGAVDAEALGPLDFDWRAVMRRLVSRGWVEAGTTDGELAPPFGSAPALTPEQTRAVALVRDHVDGYRTILLDGVTGSGKTEVYLAAIADILARGRQVLVMVPEIALTRHLEARFRARFGERVGLLHSGLADGERARAWERCRRGITGVLLATRSGVWVPLPHLGLVVVDEEHDGSFKQQDGFRYSARDVAIKRAQMRGVPIVLGSATPSLETLANVERGRYDCVRLTERARAATLPEVRAIDLRGLRHESVLSPALVRAVSERLERGEQVMLFLNRRGYAPVLMCRACGAPWRCPDCDASMVYHKQANMARCHHCDRQWPATRPARCCAREDIAPVGLGTERLEETVRATFPGRHVVRVDRDTARGAEALDAIFAQIASGEADILIGTQMVAKGLDFADITLVGIVDADNRLYSVDFRAEERFAQLLVQVAGRAGRGTRAGTVLVQTHQPDHPVLRQVIDEGYHAFAATALAERREAGLPPFAALAILRADAPRPAPPAEFLAAARELLVAGADPHTDISYPIPAQLERRAGRHRALIVISTRSRRAIGTLLSSRLEAIDQLARKTRVRWALDVDPHETL